MQVKSLILVGTLEKMCVFDPSYSKTLSQLVGKVMGLAVTQSHILFDLAPRRLALASEHPVPRKHFFASYGSLKCFTKARFESRFDFLK
ncbi:hypothetical protein LEP1GSC123_2836 [Leptospira borgpetersenii str. 200701203]|uniref:Uncharacterized protein n=1 Tax=Leptospira borgpetersenii str. 200701203 TaxID=1193007 RepID=M3HQJ0_LEPBO|nr:hypothetical protein LEP1GSC123_2836 [Leptospira borgpetersenii str. 200701203]